MKNFVIRATKNEKIRPMLNASGDAQPLSLVSDHGDERKVLDGAHTEFGKNRTVSAPGHCPPAGFAKSSLLTVMV